jgi:RND family efflux transporter MFP subunit
MDIHARRGYWDGPTGDAAALQDFMNPTKRVSSFFLMHHAWALALPLVFATLVAGCGQNQQQSGGPPPPAVTVAKPVKRTVFDYDEYVGRFTAINSVEVRARVSGYLDGLHFKDGQLVKQGDLLFTIDKRPFQNTLDQARANLVQAQSNVAFTESDYTRGQQLVRDKTITDQTFEQRAQAFRNAKASVSNNEAAVRQAELDLEFTELRAPVNGRIGDRRVSPGNLVTGGTGGNTTLLATIVSIDPIYFEFTFDEASYLRYERLARNGGQDVASRNASVPVALKLIDENDFDHKGRMDFVDNVIDRATGTIRGRAVFENPNGVLTPGMFARVRVPGSSPYEGLLVPDAAIGTEQARRFVIVIDAQDTARIKYVTLGQLTSDNLRVIKDGIGPDDRIVVSGLMQARPGAKVRPEEQGAKPAGPASAGVPPQQSK